MAEETKNTAQEQPVTPDKDVGKELDTRDRALQHAMAWGIQQVYNVNKEAQEVLKDEELSEKEKMLRLKGPGGTDYRLLNYLLLLKPLMKFVKEEFPEQTKFFEWLEDKWKLVIEHNMITKACLCKGCKCHTCKEEA